MIPILCPAFAQPSVKVRLEPGGSFQHRFFGKSEVLSIARILESGKYFSVLNPTIPYFSDGGGKKKIRKARDLLVKLKGIKSSLLGAAWVTEWPGTSLCSPPRFLAFGKLDGLSRRAISCEQDGVFWQGFDGCEDLIIYSRDKIIFWETAHEKVAVLYGAHGFLVALGLDPETGVDGERHPISGTLIGDAVFHEIFS